MLTINSSGSSRTDKAPFISVSVGDESEKSETAELIASNLQGIGELVRLAGAVKTTQNAIKDLRGDMTKIAEEMRSLTLSLRLNSIAQSVSTTAATSPQMDRFRKDVLARGEAVIRQADDRFNQGLNRIDERLAERLTAITNKMSAITDRDIIHDSANELHLRLAVLEDKVDAIGGRDLWDEFKIVCRRFWRFITTPMRERE